METLRRLALLVCLCAAIWLCYLASLSPVYTVQAVDFADDQQGLQPYTEQDQYLAQLPLDRYIQEVTAKTSIQVQGETWDDFFANVSAASTGQPAAAQWTDRIADTSGYRPAQLYFRAGEPPLDTLAGQLTASGQQVFLVLTQRGETKYLRLTYHSYSDSDFGFGRGVDPRPPDYLFYAYRRFSPWVALIGLLIYVALPRRRKTPDVIGYAGWTLVLGDFASYLLSILFFGLPIFVVGGSLQALTQAWAPTLCCWALAGLGVWLLLFTAWLADYRLAVLPDRLQITTPDGRRDYPFADMVSFQPVTITSPGWFRRLSWLLGIVALLSGRPGAAAAGLSGATGEAQGIGIDMRDGFRIYISITGQLGSRMLPGGDHIADVLAAAGVSARQEMRRIEGFGMVVGSVGDKIITAGPRFVFVWMAAAVPLLLIVGYLIYSVVPAVGPWGDQAALPAAPTSTPIPLAARDTNVEWEQILTGELPAGDGRALTQTGDGGYVVAGDYAPAARTMFVMGTDERGARQWLVTAGAAKNEIIAHSMVQAADGGYVVVGEERWMSGRSSAVHVLKVGPTGAKQWEKSYDWPIEGRIDDCTVSADDAGAITVTVWFESTIYQIKLNAAGQGDWSPPIKVRGLDDSDRVAWVQRTADGGFVLAGVTESRPGRFKDALLARTGPNGKVVWRSVFGGERSEEAAFVRATDDGGYLLTGKAQPRDIEDDDLYLVKTGADGNLVWEQTFGNEADQSGVTVQSTSDGGWLALGDSSRGIYLVKTDGNGMQQWEQTLAEAGYHAHAVCPTADGGAALTGTIFSGGLDAFLIKTRATR
jgi:hypothetical protein